MNKRNIKPGDAVLVWRSVYEVSEHGVYFDDDCSCSHWDFDELPLGGIVRPKEDDPYEYED